MGHGTKNYRNVWEQPFDYVTIRTKEIMMELNFRWQEKQGQLKTIRMGGLWV